MHLLAECVIQELSIKIFPSGYQGDADDQENQAECG